MVNLEIGQGNTQSRKGTSSESWKVVDERKCIDLDSYVTSLIHDNTKADANSTSNPTKESVERKKRKKKKKKSCKSDDNDGMQNTEQTDTLPMQSLSDEHHIQRNEDKIKRVEPNLEQGVEGSFLDDENTPSVKLSVGQKKNRKKRRKMEQNGNDKDVWNIMGQTEIIMSMLNPSEEHHVPRNEDKLKNVENDLKQEVEGSIMDDENTTSAKKCVEGKKERREKKMKGKANAKDGMQSMDQAGIVSMGSLFDENRIQGNKDNPKRVEHESKQEVDGSFVDDENTPSAKESVEQKKKGKREKRMKGKANDKAGMQIMDEIDIMTMGSLSDAHGVQRKKDNLKEVEHELKQEVERSFVDDENTASAKERIEQKKKGKSEIRRKVREIRMKGKATDNDSVQSLEQADILSIGSLSNEHCVQGTKDKHKRVQIKLEQEVEVSFPADENTASAKESVEQKKERRRRRKDRKANDTAGTQVNDQTDVMSMRSLSHEHHLQEDEDKPKKVENELDQEVEGSVVDEENTQSAKESAEPKKERGRRKNRKANSKDGTQTEDQTDVRSNLSGDYQVQGNEDKLQKVENEVEREVEHSFVDCENTPSAKECVEAKKRRRRKKNCKANANGGMQIEGQTDVDNLLKASHPSPGKTLVLFSRRKLLVLDINGLLADLVHPPPKHCKSDINIFRRAIFKRPFYYDFLKFCFERFDVGIWSSRSKKIIDPVVDYLLGDLKHKLLFCWDLSYCTASGFKTLENRHKPLVFKELRLIWEKTDPNSPWEKGDYDESNTLLLDDSPYKALINPKHTAIFPRSYTFMKRRDNSLGPGGDLRVYLEKVAAAENIQKYIEQHPFGQVGIDETSRSWDFYSRVLSSRSVVSALSEK